MLGPPLDELTRLMIVTKGAGIWPEPPALLELDEAVLEAAAPFGAGSLEEAEDLVGATLEPEAPWLLPRPPSPVFFPGVEAVKEGVSLVGSVFFWRLRFRPFSKRIGRKTLVGAEGYRTELRSIRICWQLET